MRPPAYTPPYDSPLENEFAYHIVKYLDEAVDFTPQVSISTICGLFRVDFVAVSPLGLKVGFECDGKEYHDDSRDEWRDAMMLGEDALDSVFRLRGSDLIYHMNDVIFVLSKCDASLFSERGRQNLDVLASNEVRALNFAAEDTRFFWRLKSGEDEPLGHALVERRHNVIPKGRRQFWQAAYKFAFSQGGGNLDEVIRNYRART